MSEEKAKYYTEPAAIIEQPNSRLVLRDELAEEWTVAWVKLSTAFKPHIKQLRGAPLAVWLYISLSIGSDGNAFPGIRTIAEETGYSHQAVIDAIKILEEKGYLSVRRGERRYNIYKPEFAAIGKTNEPTETVKLVDSSVSMSQLLPPDESTFSPEESSRVDLNKINKIKPEIPLSIENAIFAGVPVTEEIVQKENLRDIAPKMFERALGFSKPLPWWSNKDWEAFGEWVCERYAESKTAFGEYNIWRNTPYTKGGMSNNRIRGFVNEFYDSWDMFKMATNNRESEDNRHAL